MDLEDALNIGCGRVDDGVTILVHIDSIEVMEKTEVLKGGSDLKAAGAYSQFFHR